MIKRLRRNFIIVAMCSTFAVLAAVVGIINVANYMRVIERVDNTTQLLAENGGEFQTPPQNDSGDQIPQETGEQSGDIKENQLQTDLKEPDKEPAPDGMSPETPFMTRYFTVTLDSKGNVVTSNMGNIAAIGSDEAEDYAKEIFGNKKETGFKNIYRYRITDSDGNTMIIFLDCHQELENFRTFAVTSITVSFIGLLAVFILVLIFSKIVFRPVEESYKKQKQFITDASHEIKTPLTIIDANTEVIEMESGENQWTESTRHQIKRLSALTQQLITLSRLDENENKVEKIKFSLSDAVFDSIQPFEALAKSKEKQLDVDLDEDIYFVGNEKSIRQLVGLLVDNAIKYSTENSTMQVSLKQKGKKIYFEVFNQAEDIPQGKLDMLFERFYRLDSSRNSETGGSGIGLSVAKAIVDSHKGKITAYSQDGKSLKISVEFAKY